MKTYFHITVALKAWSRATVAALLLSMAGCAEGVKLIQETESGGTVMYPFKGDNPLLSSFRAEALDLMAKKCRGRYQIVKEGETKGLNRISQDSVGDSEMIQIRRWAIRFQCKQA